MPTGRHVTYGRRASPSALALDAALTDAGYEGDTIAFGASWADPGIALAVNKRVALETMDAAGVPTLLDTLDAPTFPVVARPDLHSQGRHLWICHTQRQLDRALTKRNRQGRPSKYRATHVQTYLPNATEYRVHVIDGQSVKMSVKLGGGNHSLGDTVFAYPHDCTYRDLLRQTAKDAVAALGVRIGAVDLMYRDDRGVFVLEVNTAPRLTDATSDTLARYVRALVGNGASYPQGEGECG